MVKKSSKKWFEMSSGVYCGVFLDEYAARKLSKILWRQTQELKEFLTSNKSHLCPSHWTLACPNGKQTIVKFSCPDDSVDDRIKLLDKTDRLTYIKGGVFLTDKKYNEAMEAVEAFYMERYDDGERKDE